jgi:DeoR/GlpR family transcriptional regulator of sugar metabolism
MGLRINRTDRFQRIKLKKNSSLLPAERQQRILEILQEQFTIRGSRLSEILGVSEMTVRRDLDTLEKKGHLERTHGGAVFRQQRVAGKFHYQSAIKKNLREKKKIAQKAASMIQPHDTIYLGEGTTAVQMVQFVEPGMPFTIFTNNLGITAEMDNLAAELILLPGTYNPGTHSVAGPLTMEMIRSINATKVFLGADGLSLNAGLTTADLEIAVIERSMIRHTRGQVIVMADDQKFGLVAEISIAPVKHVDVLITNRDIPDDFKEDLDVMAVQVVIA